MINKTSILESGWEYKYRPSHRDQIILPKRLANVLDNIISTGVIPNMILSSVQPGAGKTSFVNVLMNELNIEYEVVKAVEDASIGLIKNRLNSFCESSSFNGKPKVVWVEEIGMKHANFIEGMKSVIESSAATTRWIFTTNHMSMFEKVSEGAVISRCQVYDFNYTTEDYAEIGQQMRNRLIQIGKREIKLAYESSVSSAGDDGFGGSDGIGIEPGVFDPVAVDQIIEKRFPDFRKCIVDLQQNFIVNGGSILPRDLCASSAVVKDVAAAIKDLPIKDIRKKVIGGQIASFDAFTLDLMEELYDILPPHTHVAITKHYGEGLRHVPAQINQEANFATSTACLIEQLNVSVLFKLVTEINGECRPEVLKRIAREVR